MAAFKRIYKNYEFEITADGPVNDQTFEKFADEAIHYMEQLHLENYTPVGIFHDYGMIVGNVKKISGFKVNN